MPLPAPAPAGGGGVGRTGVQGMPGAPGPMAPLPAPAPAMPAPAPAPAPAPDTAPSMPATPRTDFPESWLWTDFVIGYFPPHNTIIPSLFISFLGLFML